MVKSKFPIKRAASKTSANVKLPSGIRVKAVNKHESATGSFPYTTLMGLFESCFLKVDGYLFERGLLKQGVR